MLKQFIIFCLIFLFCRIGYGQPTIYKSQYSQPKGTGSFSAIQTTFNYRNNIYTLLVTNNRKLTSGNDRYDIELRLFHLSSKNDTISSKLIYKANDAYYPLELLKTIVISDEANIFYRLFPINSANDQYGDSMSCVKYNFINGSTRDKTFLLDTSISFLPYCDLIYSNNKFIFALSSKRPNIAYYNYYKILDTSLNLIKEVPIGVEHIYYSHRLLNGKNNTIYHYYWGYGGCMTSQNYLPYFTMRKLDSDMTLLNENAIQDTLDCNPGTYNNVSFEYNDDTSEIYLTQLVRSFDSGWLYRNIACFWTFDDSLNLIKRAVTTIPPLTTSACTYDCCMFKAVKYYNKRYIVVLRYSELCENQLLTFDNNFNFIKKSTFNTGRVVYSDIDYVGRTFYFQGDSSHYMLPLESYDGLNTQEVDERNVFYPNPAKSKIVLKTGIQEASMIKIYSLTGVLVKIESVESNEINISELQQGMYIVELYSDDKLLAKNKLIKL